MRVTVLGCGASGGVPLTSGEWGECDRNDPRNLRRRPSILVLHGETRILVDTGPDLRMQLIDAGVSRIDAILYTHAHADHVHGLDDLRAINVAMGQAIDTFGMAGTLDEIASRFTYAFTPTEPFRPFYRPQLKPHAVDGPFSVGDVEIVPFVQDHGIGPSLGFRFGPFAYSTDVVRLDEAAFDALKGVEVWVVDCLRRKPHSTHAHLKRTLRWIDRVAPRRAVLTHMNHTLDYAALAAELPSGVEPGRDGLVIDL